MFKQHPDGLIYLNDLRLPLEFFTQLEPEYALPLGATHRTYEPGKAHILYNDSDQWGGELPWSEGDRYLSKEAHYRSAWEAYQESTSPPIGQPGSLQWTDFKEALKTSSLFSFADQVSKSNLAVSVAFNGVKDAVLDQDLSAFVYRTRDLTLQLMNTSQSLSPEAKAEFNQLVDRFEFPENLKLS